MTLSYLQTSLDKLKDAARDDVIEICINGWLLLGG